MPSSYVARGFVGEDFQLTGNHNATRGPGAIPLPQREHARCAACGRLRGSGEVRFVLTSVALGLLNRCGSQWELCDLNAMLIYH
jgi:hypothetical protein